MYRILVLFFKKYTEYSIFSFQFIKRFLFDFLVAGLSGRGGGDGEDAGAGDDGGMGNSSGRFSFSLLVGVRFGLRMDSRVSPKETSLQGRPSIVRGLGGEASTLQPIPTFLNFFLRPCPAPASSAGRFLLQRESYQELFSVNLHPPPQ